MSCLGQDNPHLPGTYICMIRLAGLCCDIFPVPGFHVQVDSCNLSWNLPTAWLENIWHIMFWDGGSYCTVLSETR